MSNLREQQLQNSLETSWRNLEETIDQREINVLISDQWELFLYREKQGKVSREDNPMFDYLRKGSIRTYSPMNRLINQAGWFTYLAYATNNEAATEMRNDFHSPLVDVLFRRATLLGKVNEYLSLQFLSLTR